MVAPLLLLLLLLLLLVALSVAERLDFDLSLHATSSTIYYVDFYLRGPSASIDLSGLTLRTVSEAKYSTDESQVDDEFDEDDDEEDDDGEGGDDEEDDDEEEQNEGDDEEEDDKVQETGDDEGEDDSDAGDDQGQKKRYNKTKKRRSLYRSLQSSSFFVDILAFHLPKSCSTSRAGCDWTQLGVGAKLNDNSMRWCCSNDAIALGLCQADQAGRLIMDPQKLPGAGRAVPIASKGDISTTVANGVIPEEESGRYVILFANCNDGGRNIQVTGSAAFRSEHGYLPGEIYGFLFFYFVLTILYFVLLLWYGIAMHLNEDSRIPIEKWIFFTILLGSAEMLFKTGDAFVWNEDGYRQIWITYIGILLGVCKRGLSRTLLVMVSLGWGVTRDSLGRKLKWIIMTGVVYVAVSAARDSMIVVAVEGTKKLSENAEHSIYDVYTLLTFVVAFIDVIYAMWILDGLTTTMEYLEELNQSRKLKRFLRLRCLYLFAIVFAAVWAIFAMVNAFSDSFVEEENAWLVDGATEVNYLIVLCGVACLWKPNPAAREYAYVMELPAMGDDGVTELELSGAVVPSAADSDDDDSAYIGDHKRNGNGFKDDDGIPTFT